MGNARLIRRCLFGAALIMSAFVGFRAVNAPASVTIGGSAVREPVDTELRDWSGDYIAVSVRHPKLTTVGRIGVGLGLNPNSFVTEKHREGDLVAREESDALYGGSDAQARSLDDAWQAARAVAMLPTDSGRVLVLGRTVGPFVAGDRIVAVDGVGLTRDNLTEVIAARQLSLTVVRDGSPFTVDGFKPKARVAGRPADVWKAALGASVEVTTVVADRPLMRIPSTTQGPSAGLIHGLVYLDALTDGDLTGGLTVAGTGTISPTGAIGPIGGTPAKVNAAIAAGADVFLVGPGNYADALEAADGRIDVVEVRSLFAAGRWLADHGGVAGDIYSSTEVAVSANVSDTTPQAAGAV